jgi:hypothetical protein
MARWLGGACCPATSAAPMASEKVTQTRTAWRKTRWTGGSGGGDFGFAGGDTRPTLPQARAAVGYRLDLGLRRDPFHRGAARLDPNAPGGYEGSVP